MATLDRELRGKRAMIIKLELLGMSLRALRFMNEMTLSDAASASGLSISHISDIERGVNNPSLHSLQCLADAYDETIQLMIFSERGR
jgi:transcriptional regulator with XRE-family HTH domain